jgi:hypothetical protein
VFEEATIPPKSAKVHDEFIVEKKAKKHVKKPIFEYAPMIQLFVDLMDVQTPVQDSFSNGLVEETIVEPIVDHPRPKATVHDEFTIGEASEYRSKRSFNS